MNTSPPNLSLREEQAITRWRDEQRSGSAASARQTSHTCRCGAWLRSEMAGGTRCSRSEAQVNRFGEQVGTLVCDGQNHPGDRILLLATICGVENIVVGLVRSWGGEKPWIAGCALCGWHPDMPEDADVRTLVTHLVKQHGLADEAIQRIGPRPSFGVGSKAA